MKSTHHPFSGCALFGLGYWGRNIFRNLVELGSLRAVCEPNTQTIASFAPDHPGIRFATDPDSILSDPAIRSVCIAAPAALHAALATKAIEAGKDVFVEKPLGLTLEEGTRVVERASTLKRVLMVGHVLQYHPAVGEIRRLLDEGTLGTLRYIYSNRLNLGKIRTEENIMWSFAPHDISLILSIAGAMPTHVRATGGSYVTEGVVDTTITTLEFPGVLKGHVFVSWLHPFKEQKLVIVGSKSMLVFDDTTKEKLFLYRHAIDMENSSIPRALKAPHEVVPVGPGEPLKEELLHFLTCVETRERPRTDGEEGLRVLTVLEQANRSLNKGIEKHA